MDFFVGKGPGGKPIVKLGLSEITEPTKLMRALKQACPNEWREVNYEIMPATKKDIAAVEEDNAYVNEDGNLAGSSYLNGIKFE